MAWPFTRRGPEAPTLTAELAGGQAMAAQVIRPGFLGRVASTEPSTPAARMPRRKAEEWQSGCWDAYHQTGAVKFLVRYDANAVSKVRLVVGVTTTPGVPPTTLDDTSAKELGVPPEVRLAAEQELGRLGDCLGGQSLMLKLLAMHFRVAGECWLLGWPAVEAKEADPIRGTPAVPAVPERWEVRSVEEVSSEERVLTIKDGGTGQGRIVKDEEEVFVARLWEPDPRSRQKADSNLRALLLDCDLLLALAKQAVSVALSRVAFGGVLAVSTDADFGNADPTKEGPQAEPLTQDLIDHFSTPIGDPGSASGIAPYVFRASTDVIRDGIKFIPMTREVDRWSQLERKDAVARIGVGMDAPPEVLTGYGDVNKWNGLLVDEAKFSAHHEPLVISICTSLTISAYRKLLTAREVPPPPEWLARLVVWFDASDLITDASRAENAKWAHDSGIISDEAARRELHFPEEDAPDAETTPAAEAAALTAAAGRADNPVATRVATRLAQIESGLRTRLGEAADAALSRALDRAGAKLRSRLAGAGTAGRTHGNALEAIRTVPNLSAAATLGRALTRGVMGLAEDTGDEALIDESSFEPLHARYLAMVGTAQKRARAELARLGVDDSVLDQLDSRQASDREAAWSWLVGALGTLAAARLFDPHPGMPATGEQPVNSSGVPVSLIREALGRAGGGGSSRTADGGVVGEDGQPVGGAVMGRSTSDALDTVDAVVTGYAWDYGDPASRIVAFEDHERLDTTEFTSWDDPVLEGNFPGDHFQCQCSVIWTLEQAGTVASEEAA